MTLKKLIKQGKKKFHYGVYHLFPRIYAPSYWLKKACANHGGDVVQIGSNDGKVDDPIYQLVLANKSWRAFFVEAVDYIAENLKKNYGNDARFTFCNIAINDGKTEIFYFVNPKAKEALKNLPPHYDKLGSFIKSNILKHLGSAIEPFIEEKEIEGMSLKSFFAKYSITNLLLLHIDTEGYDWIILKQLDLNTHRPRAILFEHKHLSMADKEESVERLSEYYSLYKFGQDMLCLTSDVLKELGALDTYILSKKQFSFKKA